MPGPRVSPVEKITKPMKERRAMKPIKSVDGDGPSIRAMKKESINDAGPAGIKERAMKSVKPMKSVKKVKVASPEATNAMKAMKAMCLLLL